MDPAASIFPVTRDCPVTRERPAAPFSSAAEEHHERYRGQRKADGEKQYRRDFLQRGLDQDERACPRLRR